MAEGQDDDARISEIRARLEKATPGPWRTWPDGTEESVESVSVGRFVCHLNSNMRQFREDAAFIAHAREDVPYLLARLDALAAERDKCQRMLEDLTPGGSEFYRNPIRCRNWVQDRLSSAHTRTVKAVQERDALTARMEAAEAALSVERALDEVYEWQRETFPSRTPSSITAHLLEEAGELAREPLNADEMADVAMLLGALVRDTGTDLAAAIRAKLAKNRVRDWSAPPNEQGYVKARAALAGSREQAAEGEGE